MGPYFLDTQYVSVLVLQDYESGWVLYLDLDPEPTFEKEKTDLDLTFREKPNPTSEEKYRIRPSRKTESGSGYYPFLKYCLYL